MPYPRISANVIILDLLKLVLFAAGVALQLKSALIPPEEQNTSAWPLQGYTMQEETFVQCGKQKKYLRNVRNLDPISR